MGDMTDYKLVPVEPSPEMVKVGQDAANGLLSESLVIEVFKDMLGECRYTVPQPTSDTEHSFLKYGRAGRLLCWLLYGHCWDKTDSRQPMSREMNRCKFCSKEIAGPD